jgi:hypothetical protein
MACTTTLHYAVPCYAMLYCTIILYCTILKYTTPCYTILHYTILYCIILYYTILYCIILRYTILYCIILYCIILYYTILYCIILYYTILYYRKWTVTEVTSISDKPYPTLLYPFSILCLYLAVSEVERRPPVNNRGRLHRSVELC